MERAFIAKRHTPKMGAITIYDQPLILTRLDAVCVGLRITQRRYIGLLCRFNFVFRTMPHKNEFSAPEKFYDLPFGYRRKVKFDGRTSRDRYRVGTHLTDERPNRTRKTNRTRCGGRNKQEIASRRFG